MPLRITTGTMNNGVTLLGTWPQLSLEQGQRVELLLADNLPPRADGEDVYFARPRRWRALGWVDEASILLDPLDVKVDRF